MSNRKKKKYNFFYFLDSSEDEGMIESSNLDVSLNATNEPIVSESFIEEMEAEENEAKVWNDEDNEVQDEESGLESEELVHHALSYVPRLEDVEIEPTPSDALEGRLVSDFVVIGCGCQLWNGCNCSLQFSSEHFSDIRSYCSSLSHTELDMALLGQIMALSDITIKPGYSLLKQKRVHTTYIHLGKQICRTTFRFLHGVGRTRIENLMVYFADHGLVPRTHGNLKCLPKHALSFTTIEYVVKFLVNHAENNAILLPGRIPGYKETDIKLLPSSTSKRRIWRFYHESVQSINAEHSVAYSTFNKLWKTLLPSIIRMKPMTDLCWTCQKNSTAIVRAVNSSDIEKNDTINAAENHLFLVHLERSFYKTQYDSCRADVQSLFSVDGIYSPPEPNCNIPPNSNKVSVHYSFDYAQQVHYPSDPQQPGPIFFLTPRKCSLFGFHCEALPQQVNFLTDEAADCGKGAIVVVSQLDYFFSHHGQGEMEVFPHCDNCTGQNKNNTMIHYLLWRCMTGLHTMVTLPFLVVGHTKFAPDWCFGLVKRLYRRTKVG